MLKSILCLLPAIQAVHLASKAKTFSQPMCPEWEQIRARQAKCPQANGYETIVCRMFAIFDADESDDVTRDELYDVLEVIEKCYGRQLTEREWEIINSEFDKADHSGNGIVTREEF